MLPLKFHSYSLGWLHVSPCVPLLLTYVTPFHFTCFTHSLTWFHVIPGLPLLITVILHHFKWPIATHFSIYIIPDVWLPIFMVALCCLMCSMLLTRVVLHCSWCPTSAHWGVFTLFQVSHCHELDWLSFILCFCLLLTGIASCYSRCFTTHLWGGCVSSAGISLLIFGWIWIIPNVLMMLTKVGLHYSIVLVSLTRVKLCGLRCPLLFNVVILCHSSCSTDAHQVAVPHLMYPTANSWGGSLLCQVSHDAFCSGCLFIHLFHCFSLGWTCIVPSVLLLLTGIVSCNPLFFIVASGVSRHFLMFSTSAHCGGYALSQMFHCYLLRLLSFFSDISLPFTWVVVLS